MLNNYKKIIFAIVSVILFSGAMVVSAAPQYIFQKSIIPETDNTYYLGSTSPNARWKGVYTTDLNITGTCTGCGGGGAGTVSTSTVPTVGHIPYWTSNGFPSLLGSVATGTVSSSGGVTVTTGQSIIGSGLTVGCTVASASNAGCLSSANWSTFNNKVSSQWVTNGSDIYYNTGNVGIGTTTPAAVLNAVAGVSDFRFSQGALNLTPTVAAINTGASGKAVALVAGTSGSSFAFDSAGFFAIQAESKSAFVNNTVGIGSLYMMVTGTGNVGIAVSDSTVDNYRFNVRAATDNNLGVRSNGGALQLVSHNDADAVYGSFKIDGSSILLNSASGGNVGIGTASPAALLNAVSGVSDIRFTSGASSVTPTVSVINTTSSTGKAAALLAGTTGAFFVYDNSGIFDIGNEDKAQFLANNSSGSGSYSSKLRILSNGNVGIGTTNPVQLLNIASANTDIRAGDGFLSSTPTLSVINVGNSTYKAAALFAGTGYSGFNFSTDNSGYFVIGGQSKAGFTGNAVANGSDTAFMTILGDGKVGIGTTTPQGFLNVRSSSGATPSIVLDPGLAPGGTATTTGSFWHDVTQKALAFFTGGASSGANGLQELLAGNMYTATATTTVNTSAETSLYNTSSFIGTTTVPANWPVAGKSFYLHARGQYSTPVGNVESVTGRVKYGATTVGTVTTAAFPASATNQPFKIDVDCTFRTGGSSAKLVCDGELQYQTIISGTNVWVTNDLSTIGEKVVDTTTKSNFDVTADWSATAFTSQSIQVTQSWIDINN